MDQNNPKSPNFPITPPIDFSNLVDVNDIPNRRVGKDGTFTSPAIIVTHNPVIPNSLTPLTIPDNTMAIQSIMEQSRTIRPSLAFLMTVAKKKRTSFHLPLNWLQVNLSQPRRDWCHSSSKGDGGWRFMKSSWKTTNSMRN